MSQIKKNSIASKFVISRIMVFSVFLSIGHFLDANDGETEAEAIERSKKEAEEKYQEMKRKHPGLQKLKFKPPTLSDEDNLSQHMPFHVKCDGCRIIAYHLKENFDHFNKLHTRLKKNIPLSDILTLVEKTCDRDYNDYGAKEVNGNVRLSGPALPDTSPGMIQGGGKWPNRLSQMCFTLVGEVGEEEIYDAYLKANIEKWLCKGEGIRDSCNTRNDHLENANKKNKHFVLDKTEEADPNRSYKPPKTAKKKKPSPSKSQKKMEL